MAPKFHLVLCLSLAPLLASSVAADGRADGALIRSVLDGDVEATRAELGAGADSNALDPNGISALMLAAASGNVALVDLLLRSGAAVDRASAASGRTALSFAAEAGHAAVTEALLAAGANVDHRGPADLGFEAVAPAISLAALAGRAEVVALLMRRGADATAEDGRGMRPMHHAALGGRIDIARLLRKTGAEIDRPTRFSITPLMAAATSLEAWPLVAWLLGAGADPNRPIGAAGATLLGEAPGMTALMLAALDGAELNAYMLILGGADTRRRRADGATAAKIARNRLERGGLGSGGRVSAERLEEVLRAPRLGRTLAMEVIADGLERRVRAGERDALATVLRLGFDPNVPREGDPLLFAAIDGGDVEMVELLLGHGANSNARSRRGITALHHAVGLDRPAIIRRLIEKGANPSLRAKGMVEMPLHLAAARGEPLLLLALLEAGARPNTTDRRNDTPLHRAVRAGHLAAAKLLRRFGADPALANDDGQIPLDLAPAARRDDFEAVLR